MENENQKNEVLKRTLGEFEKKVGPLKLGEKDKLELKETKNVEEALKMKLAAYLRPDKLDDPETRVRKRAAITEAIDRVVKEYRGKPGFETLTKWEVITWIEPQSLDFFQQDEYSTAIKGASGNRQKVEQIIDDRMKSGVLFENNLILEDAMRRISDKIKEKIITDPRLNFKKSLFITLKNTSGRLRNIVFQRASEQQKITSGNLITLLEFSPDDATKEKLFKKMEKDGFSFEDGIAIAEVFSLVRDKDKSRLLEILKRIKAETILKETPSKILDKYFSHAPTLYKEITEVLGKKFIERMADSKNALNIILTYSKNDTEYSKEIIRWSMPFIKTNSDMFAVAISYVTDQTERDQYIFQECHDLVISNYYAFAAAYKYCSPQLRPQLLAKSEKLLKGSFEQHFDRNTEKGADDECDNIAFLVNFLPNIEGFGREIQIQRAISLLRKENEKESLKQKAVLLLIGHGTEISKFSTQELVFCAKTLLDTRRTTTPIDSIAGNEQLIEMAKAHGYNLSSYFSVLIAIQNQNKSASIGEKIILAKQIIQKRLEMGEKPMMAGSRVFILASKTGEAGQSMKNRELFDSTYFREIAKLNDLPTQEERYNNKNQLTDIFRKFENQKGPLTMIVMGHGTLGRIALGLRNEPNSVLSMDRYFELLAKDPDKVRQIIFLSCFSNDNAQILLNSWKKDPRTSKKPPPIMLTSTVDPTESLQLAVDAWTDFAQSRQSGNPVTWNDFWRTFEGKSMILADTYYKRMSDPGVYVPADEPGKAQLIGVADVGAGKNRMA